MEKWLSYCGFVPQKQDNCTFNGAGVPVYGTLKSTMIRIKKALSKFTHRRQLVRGDCSGEGNRIKSQDINTAEGTWFSDQCPQKNDEALAVTSTGDSALAIFSHLQVLSDDQCGSCL
ncbi:hypothetical protein P4H35_15245 [Paenibacillus taichungensis]|nr:hypothetical protein [Paenibacillus taichungensis]MEC0197703.1 hypothetical protein [Paenibacillus taichungensis]